MSLEWTLDEMQRKRYFDPEFCAKREAAFSAELRARFYQVPDHRAQAFASLGVLLESLTGREMRAEQIEDLIRAFAGMA